MFYASKHEMSSARNIDMGNRAGGGGVNNLKQ